MSHKDTFYLNQATTIIKKLNQRHMEGYFCESAQEAKLKALSLIEEDSVISWGGSQTIAQTGLIDALKKGPYTLLDRSQAENQDEVRDIYLKAFTADYYLMSSNAITLDGKLVNVDGNGNRVAALIYGPKNVIVIVGMNKVVLDEAAAIQRVRNFSAPANALRVGAGTPCTMSGRCHECMGENTICCNTVITRISRYPNRIKVILVGEELGY